MAENTAIEWADHTFNPWIGCTKVSPACDHCYAEARMDTRLHVVQWGAGQPRKRTQTWGDPVKWNKQPFVQCAACGYRCELRHFHAVDGPADFTMCPKCSSHDYHGARARVFCASLADVFDNEVDPAWRRDLFALIEKTPNLDWLLLTKRIGNVKPMMIDVAAGLFWMDALDTGALPSNAWLGATIVNQAEADRDIIKLMDTQAAKRFLSIEPLLGPITLERWLKPMGLDTDLGLMNPGIDWVIVGGESGPKARPMHPDWARSLRDQCVAAGVPFFFKQWGEWATVAESPVHPEATRIPGNLCKVTRDGITADHYVAISTDGGRRRYELRCVGKKAAGRLLDGREWSEVPV